MLAASLLASSCEGDVAVNDAVGPEVEEEYVPGPIMDRMPTVDDCDTEDVFTNSAPTRLLTRYEFDNTVRDLVGVDARLAWENLPAENAAGGFENTVDGHSVNPLYVRKLLEIAEEIAPLAVERGALSGSLEAFLTRAFRRPATEEEVAAFTTLRTTAAERWGADRADEILVSAVLQSPQFLYRTELVDRQVPREIVQITSYEMASRLSYMLWGTMPDAELFAAAASDEIQTEPQIALQVRRMLQDPRAAETVNHFYRQWLHLDALDTIVKDAATFPGTSASLPQDWRASIDAFVRHVHFEGGGDLRALMTSSTVFLTPDMASLYGEPAPSALEPVSMEHRSGLITQPALMALLAYPNQGSPVHRGIFVREKLLCQHLGPPPDDVALMPPDPDPNATTRERFAQHASDATCAGCHRLIDPIGFGFEGFDGVGHYRTLENGVPVDTSGEMFNSGDPNVDGVFTDASDLASKLADSPKLMECVADTWMTFALGHRPTTADLCSARAVRERFAETDGSFEELLVAIATSDALRYRTIQGPP